MTAERLQLNLSYLVDKLKDQGASVEIIKIRDGKPVYSLFSPGGIEMVDLLDREHLPSITKFSTVIFSEEFADLRFKPAEDVGTAIEVGGSSNLLKLISETAADTSNYEVEGDAHKVNRRNYRKAAAYSLRNIHLNDPIGESDVVVGVKRCGDNLCEELGIDRVSLDAKRLRFKDFPHLLGAGVNLSYEMARLFEGKRMRLQEGVVAAGTTESVFIAALRNWGIVPLAVDCDATIVCPAGASFVTRFKEAVEISGLDKGAFVGGQLDSNWYVRYGIDDRLLYHLQEDRAKFIGKQILGDGGDLTSNI
jgi:hypothetical protein